MDVTEGESEEEAVDADQQLATVAPAAAEEEEGGEKGEDSAAGSSIAAWDDDAAVTLAAAGFWQAEAGTDAGSGAELVQLWEEDGEDGTAADAAAVEDVAAVDPAVLRQQQLRQAAATAGLNLQGGAALFADADAAASEQDSSWEEDEVLEGDQQLPGWTVERLFDCLDAGSVDSAAADAGVAGSGTSSSSSSGLSSQHAAAEQLLQDSKWVLDCLDGSSGSRSQVGGQQQQQQQFVYGDSLEAAAAAQAALRASDAAAAAAAAVQPPNLQVPAHLPILFALQCTVHELERSPHLAGAFQLDSSSNNSESHVAQSEPPFAWMYPAAGLPATAAAAAGSRQQPAVVQHILRTLQNADPRGNWRFELPPTVLPNSSELLPPLDSSLQQYVLTSAQQQQRLQRRLDARDRQSRLLQRFQERVQELRGAVVTPAQDPLAQSRQSRLQEQVQELWGAVVSPAQDPLVQSFIESAPRPLKPFVQLLLDPMSLFRSSSSGGGGSSQLPAADAAAADADTADACGDEQQQQQQQQQEEEEEDSQEQLLLARVTEMSVGTYWEPFAWSVLTQQPTQVANGRLADPTVQQRLPLSRPLSRQAARAEQQQREQDLQQQRQRRQQQMQAAQVQKAAAAASDWFGPILYAAYAATQQVGQLVLAPVLAQQDSIPVTPGSSGSSSSNGAAASSTAAVAPATLALQAVPPSQPGWDPLTRAWQGVYLPPREAVPSRAQLAAKLQREVRLGQAAIQWARAKAPVCLHLQSDAARDVILAEFQDCQTAAALLECMQQYAHYVDHYPDLPVAALQQAAKLWAADAAATTAPAAAAEAAGGAAAAAAAPAGAGSVGRRQRRKKLLSAAAEADTLSISISSSSSSGSQGVSVFAAAAAAGGNIDALITASVQLPNPLATGEDPAKSSLFDALVAWLTKTQATRQQPLEQLLTKHFPATLHADILQQHSAASSAASSSNSNSAELPAGAGSQHSTAQCLVQLLTLGMDHRGSALPAGISLLQLLQQQQLGQLSLATILQLSQQLLSPGAALQTWPAAEQHAAFQLLHDSVKHLLPQALLQLLTLLTRQQHLGSLPSELLHQPGALYRAVLAQLAVQAAAVLGGQSGQQLLGEFAAAGPQLLQLAQQACLSAGALTLQAHQDGIVLPGSSYFTQAVNSASYPRTGPEYRGWVIGQHKDFISRLRACRKQAAATPVVADAVLRAGASGHLQKVAAVLRVLLAPPQKQPKQQQQQFDAAQAAELLQMLACARPFVNFSGMWDARQVANRFSESEADLRAGANAFAHLPGAVAAWLVQQQGQGQSTPVQQLPPEAILRTLRAALQLQLAHKSVLACVDSLCECPPAAAGTSTAASSSDSTSSSSSTGGSGSTHLHGWSMLDLHRLLELTRTEQLHLSQQHLDVIASAAAQRAHELGESFAAAAGLGSTLDLSAYTAGGPAAALAADAKSERGRRRSGAAAAAAAADPQWLKRSLGAVCDTAFSFSIRDQYQPQLLYALQELLVVAARASFNSSSSTSSKGGKGARTLSSRLVRIMQPANFTKALYCLAAFNSCSAQTSAAVRQLLPSYLPALQQQGLSRTAWALAVLNERDARVWADVRHAIAHRDSRGMRAAADAEDGLQEGLTAAAATTEKTPGSQQWIYTQVHQANVFVEHCVPAAAPLLPPELARKALDVHAGLAQDPTVSQLQRDVGHVLGEMQASATSRLTAYELEHKTVLGSTDIKVSMQDAQCKVAVEVDGPFHYAKNPPYKHTQRTGSTVLRDRLLEVKGFAVLCLPYWDIGQQKQAGDKAMLAWMEGLLVKAAATPPPRSSSGESSGRVDLEAYRSTL